MTSDAFPVTFRDLAPQTQQLLAASGQRVADSLGSLATMLRCLGARSVLLVVDETAARAAGAETLLRQGFSTVDCLTFNRFSPNPKLTDATAAVEAARQSGADAVVAVGGGSCIDVAKLAALGARLPAEVGLLQAGDCPTDVRPLPLIACPTTSGSGSEATHFAVAYAEGRKRSIAHPGVRPSNVILDARLVQAMPARLAATSGLDALSQSLEAMWAAGSTPASDAYASEAARLIVGAIEPSVREGRPDARRAMMLGAHLAGQAINLSKTTAAHAMSYPLTSLHGVPHGHAVALFLGWVGAANGALDEADCQHPLGAEHVRRAVAAAAAQLGSSVERFPLAVADLLKRLGLASSLQEAGVPAHGLATLLDLIDPVRLGNNPRRLSRERLGEILELAHRGAAG
ncbi:Phosphonoacetaldehyde reductase [Posidoniimonas corsicana]|uniref:Phosphonoacetaldehyde reductase n=1 Tax=Posidoniimonas corsicana TaxID=1938618 RepID=A0A5C5V7R3_9BACT|nr:phosphonoacetaldehyde reductase [Posidoniimonas corsicana]TWT33805.1 Phosphonoacetaldehyde reductase [Posidoniimonas corsicana]